ncbi:MAG: copper chaperone PCu(A)C, partial [Alphaproteobacteria bacterium]
MRITPPSMRISWISTRPAASVDAETNRPGLGRIAAALLATAFLPTTFLVAGMPPARAHDYTQGDLRIGHPWTRATAPSAKVGAGYMTIANGGASADRLVSASTPASARVEIHEMRMD